MATQLKLDPESESLIDDLLASGRFTGRIDVLRHGIRPAFDEERAIDGPLAAEEIAELERRIAEADADRGGGIPAGKVSAELRQRYQNGK